MQSNSPHSTSSLSTTDRQTLRPLEFSGGTVSKGEERGLSALLRGPPPRIQFHHYGISRPLRSLMTPFLFDNYSPLLANDSGMNECRDSITVAVTQD